jgi:hypothetical protein
LVAGPNPNTIGKVGEFRSSDPTQEASPATFENSGLVPEEVGWACGVGPSAIFSNVAFVSYLTTHKRCRAETISWTGLILAIANLLLQQQMIARYFSWVV